MSLKILVTGGAGYVGSTLVNKLISLSHKVKVLDNLRFGGESLLRYVSNSNFEFAEGDIRDESIVKNCMLDADIIIHLAAIVGFPACKRDPMLAYTTNFDGTANIVNNKSPNQVLMFASTGSVYGAIPEGICTEKTPINPLTIYGKTKYQAEQLVMDAGNSVAFRFATAFGVSQRMRFDLLPNDFVYQAVKNKQLIVYESGFKRTFIHVSDMTRIFTHSIGHWGLIKNEVYNVGDESMNYTKKEIAEQIKRKTNCYLHFAEVGTDADKRDYEVDYSKVQSRGWQTTITMDQGINELILATNLINIRNRYVN